MTEQTKNNMFAVFFAMLRNTDKKEEHVNAGD